MVAKGVRFKCSPEMGVGGIKVGLKKEVTEKALDSAVSSVAVRCSLFPRHGMFCVEGFRFGSWGTFVSWFQEVVINIQNGSRRNDGRGACTCLTEREEWLRVSRNMLWG